MSIEHIMWSVNYEELMSVIPLPIHIYSIMLSYYSLFAQVLGNKIRNSRDHKFVSYWTPSDFVKNCLFWHNFYRHFHRSSELVLSPHVSLLEAYKYKKNISKYRYSDYVVISLFIFYINANVTK